MGPFECIIGWFLAVSVCCFLLLTIISISLVCILIILFFINIFGLIFHVVDLFFDNTSGPPLKLNKRQQREMRNLEWTMKD